METSEIPHDLVDICAAAVRSLRSVYQSNAARHEPLLGDDAVTFGINTYRNSWFSIENEIADIEGWTTSRPEGSLVLSGARYRIHVYRFGNNEMVDLGRFRLDDAKTSATKRHIAESNALQHCPAFS